jgi:hemerythrin-like domain-containing protein
VTDTPRRLLPVGSLPMPAEALPGHHAPAAGFDAPFEMLGACHERVLRSLDLLDRLITHVRQAGVDDGARRAAADVARYFTLAAPQHHLDEERHLLPRWLADPDADLQAAARQIVDDHLAFAALWRDLGPALAAVADGAAGDWALINRVGRAFIDRHERHLQLEDGLLFPAARAGMGEADLARMGAEMAARRQA